MPWTDDDYPQSWKNQPDDVRSKAIEIGNALLADGMPDGRAIPIALAKAREAVGVTESKAQWVVPHEDGWAVKTEGAERVRKVFERKTDAVDAAVDYARRHDTSVTVQRGDGSIEDRQSFRSRL